MKHALQVVASTLLSWGPWGMLLLAILDSGGVPIPDAVDFLLLVVATRDLSVGYRAAALVVAGSLVGNLFLFYVGRKGGHQYLEKKTRTGWARRFRNWFHHYGGLTVFIPALMPIPLPLKIFVLSAGALDMKLSHFVLIVLAARIPRYFGLVYLGGQMGTRPWEYIKGHVFELLGFSAGLFAILLFAGTWIRKYRLAHGHAPRTAGLQ